jgi:DNA-binding winged helix-turn-helix (wHTH) protein
MPLTNYAPNHGGDEATPQWMFGPAAAEPTIEFGRFRVLPRRRELLADGLPIELSGRAFDILLALVEADGLLVTKEDLLNRAWPDRIVEENNLNVQISALRKALGSDRDLIRTEFGRGYRLTAAMRTIAAPNARLGMTRQGHWRNRRISHGWCRFETARPVSDATAGTDPASSRQSGENDASDGFDPRNRSQRRRSRGTNRRSRASLGPAGRASA